MTSTSQYTLSRTGSERPGLPPRPLHWLLLALLAFGLSACGGNGTNLTTAGTGTLGVVLTDAPSDAFSAINMTVEKILLLSTDDEPVSIFEGEETINLLALRDHAELFALADVPAGDYHKIRLILKQPDGLELVLSSGEKHYPRLPGNGKIDLNPRATFSVTEGEIVYAHIDLDAEKSIHAVANGNGQYQFRPVVFVDIIDDDFAGKLVRRNGSVHEIKDDLSSFTLCDRQPMPPVEQPVPLSAHDLSMEHDLMSCMHIDTQNASLFANDGVPMPLQGLTAGSQVMVIGFLRRHRDENGTDEPLINYATLSAEVIETLDGMNTVETVEGTVASAPTDALGNFDLTLADGSTVTSLLQDGTKVFGRDGSRLDVNAIQPDVLARAEGVRFLDGLNEVLRSSLVILDTASTTGLSKLSGTVNTWDVDRHILNLATASGDQDAMLGADTVILVIGTGDGSATSSAADSSALETGTSVEIYGRPSALGFFVAQVVLLLN